MGMMKDFEIIQQDEYVRFNYTGEFSPTAGNQVIDAMIEACSRLQRSKALLDCRKMAGEIKTLESFMVADYGGKMRGFLSKMALVGREDQMLLDSFVENVAVNRGVNLKIFTDFEEALAWLEE